MSDRTLLHNALFLAGLAGFVFLLYGLYQEGFLNPFLIATATVVVLWPIREVQAVRGLFWAGGFLLAVWLLSELGDILVPFAAVYVLAYLFNPAVRRLEQWGNVPRWLSAISITLLVIGGVGLVLVLVLPTIATELSTLATRLLGVIKQLQIDLPESGVITYLVEQGLIDRSTVQAQFAQFLPQQIEQLAGSIPGFFDRLVRSVGSITSGIIMAAVLPVLFFYVLKDYPVIEKNLIRLFPTVQGRRDYLLSAGQVVGKYLRGQLLISAIAAFDVAVLLMLLDVPFALLIGLTAGVMNMIPNFGVILTGVLGVLLAAVFGEPWLFDSIAVVGVLLGQSLLETTLLTPNIMSYQVGVHPVLVLLSLFVFGSFLGVLGLLIAVPTTAVLAMVYRAYREEHIPDLSRDDRSGSD